MAILKLSEATLLQLDLESTMSYLSQFPHGSAWVLQKEKLVPAALSIKVSPASLFQLSTFDVDSVFSDPVHFFSFSCCDTPWSLFLFIVLCIGKHFPR